MSDVVELLERAEPYLKKLVEILNDEYSAIDPDLNDLAKDIGQMLGEYEALQVGHMVRQ